jgi:hypothetical protein
MLILLSPADGHETREGQLMVRVEDALGSALAVIGLSESEGPQGGGVLLTGTHVLTCAHVVNSSLGRNRDAEEAPDQSLMVKVAFPFVSSGEYLDARIDAWIPPRQDRPGDLAVVELVEPAPEGSRPTRLIKTSDLNRHEFWCYGFPSGYRAARLQGAC